MQRINKLSSYIYNRIAAGEVVERPASVVKELVENSIDAGATEVSVSILGGGNEKIIVTDNGGGIYPDDFELAFAPHATSKISAVEDLDDIMTLGFRGEALSSIASVSKVTLKSRVAENETAYSAIFDGITLSKNIPVGGNVGTQITVASLFYNTPARAKYMKKAKSEEQAITLLMTKLMLANPSCRFNYYSEEKLLLQSPGKELLSVIKSIYPKDIYSELLDIEYEIGEYRLSGYILPPTVTRHNKNTQTVTVNGRIITNSAIAMAIIKAYGERIFTGQHPVYILNLTLKTREVDINVTPSKTDARFFDADKLFSIFYHAVRNRLSKYEDDKILRISNELRGVQNSTLTCDNMENAHNTLSNQSDERGVAKNSSSPLNYEKRGVKPQTENSADLDNAEGEVSASSIISENERVGGLKTYSSPQENNKSQNTEINTFSSEINDRKTVAASVDFNGNSIQNSVDFGKENRQNNVDFGDNNKQNSQGISLSNEQKKQIDALKSLYSFSDENMGVAEGSNFLKIIANKKQSNDEFNNNFTEKTSEENLSFAETTKDCETKKTLQSYDFNVIGVCFNTYLMVSTEQKLYFVDIHAANERMLYDRLIKGLDTRKIESQPYLIPEVIDLEFDDYSYIIGLFPELAKLGFDIEEFGDTTIKISAVPLLLTEINIRDFISELARNKSVNFSSSDILKEKLSLYACKNSIKAGTGLTTEQGKIMAEKIFLKGNMPLTCPHGRPIIIEMTKSEIERKFKR